MREEYVELPPVLVKKLTEKAALIEIDDETEAWIPLSVIEDGDSLLEGDEYPSLNVQKWFAVKEGLPILEDR